MGPSEPVRERWRATSCSWTARDFLDRLGLEPFALLHGEGPGTRFTILGEDPLWIAQGPEVPFPAFERSGEAPPVLPDLVGFLSYELGYRWEGFGALPQPFPFPECRLVVYRRILVHDRVTGLLHEGWRDLGGTDGGRTDGGGTAGSGEGAGAGQRNLLAPGPFSARKLGDSDDREGYMAKVAIIREAIGRGDVYQAALTRQERWAYEGDLRIFARRLQAANPAPWSAFIAGTDHAIVSSSPEAFLRIRGGRITTRPIKGTAPRGREPGEDAALARGLLASAKDRAELAMIADLLRNDLARVCRMPSVGVQAFPLLESYPNVHHLVAEVAGDLLPGTSLLDLLRATFPGGSITGCPKIAAMALLRALEAAPRMAYTGALGWCSWDLAQADFNLNIRTVVAGPNELMLGTGGGVVWDSDPAREYDETVHKGRSLVQCLN